MKRIRFYYSYVGWIDAHEDVLLDDDTPTYKLNLIAEDIANKYLPKRKVWYEEIADDDDSWEGE